MHTPARHSILLRTSQRQISDRLSNRLPLSALGVRPVPCITVLSRRKSMSGKKSKRKKQKAPTNPQRSSGQKPTGDDMHVNGEIEIRRSPSLTEEHETERREDDARENRKWLVDRISLLFVVIVAGLTAWQGWSTKKAVDVSAQSMPVGSESVDRPKSN